MMETPWQNVDARTAEAKASRANSEEREKQNASRAKAESMQSKWKNYR